MRSLRWAPRLPSLGFRSEMSGSASPAVLQCYLLILLLCCPSGAGRAGHLGQEVHSAQQGARSHEGKGPVQSRGPMVRGLLSPTLLLSGIYDPQGPSGILPESSSSPHQGRGILGSTSPTPTLSCFSSIDTHHLSYDFIITPKFRPEPRWCKVQGQMDKRAFLHYDCVNHKAKAFGSLGKKVNVTKTWEEQTETLRDVVDFLKEQLPNIQMENVIPSEPLTLQAQMSCEHKAHGYCTAFWQFIFNGQRFLLFDSNNRNWTVFHPGARQLKEKWEKNSYVTMFFQRISTGDCKMWLEKFLIYWKQILEKTTPPSMTPGTVQPKSRATTLSTWSLLVFLPCFILLIIFK
ncbi:UL16-binding protein 1-like [Sapajus apella]|uniref:UL16-binding protein 1-like n=1 Tax=Sapajus apella TaxID=9515 RepID=A0A6J3HII6_SAPAP|nr:UL16-binding protein 1-like [Sapajus apella]